MKPRGNQLSVRDGIPFVFAITLSINLLAAADNRPALAAAPSPTPAPAAKSQPAGAAGKSCTAALILIGQGDAAALGGNLGEARKSFKAALDAAQADGDKKTTVLCLDRVAGLHSDPTAAAEEEQLRQKALDTAKQAFGADSAQAAMEMAQLAGCYGRKGAIGEARSTLDAARAILDRAGGDHALQNGVYWLNEASLQTSQNLPAMAEETLQKACALLSTDESGKYYLAAALSEQATVLEQMERKSDAQKVREKLALLRGTATAPSTDAAAPAGNTAFDNYVKMAQAAVLKADRETAMTNWKLALAEAEKGSESDGRQAFVLVHLGDEYAFKMQAPEALAMYRKGLELREKTGATRDLGMARNLNRLAKMAIGKQDYPGAEALLTKALGIEEACDAGDSIIADTLTALNTTYMMEKNASKSEGVCKRLLSIANKGTVGNAAVLKATCTATLGGLLMQTGRLQEGLEMMKQIGTGATQMAPAVIAKQSFDELVKVEQIVDAAEEKAFSVATKGATTAAH